MQPPDGARSGPQTGAQQDQFQGAAKAEDAHRGGGSQPADPLASQEFESTARNEDRNDQRGYRLLRNIGFAAFGSIALMYYLVLLLVLFRIGDIESLSAILHVAKDWHYLVFIGIYLAVFTAVPLSLSLSLVRMSGSQAKGEAQKDNPAGFTTATSELLKAIADAISKK